MTSDDIKTSLTTALNEYFDQVTLPENGLFVLGFSSSEVMGAWMGQNSNQAVGETVINTLLPILKKHHLNLAVQGCQHINRHSYWNGKLLIAGVMKSSPWYRNCTLVVPVRWLPTKPSRIR